MFDRFETFTATMAGINRCVQQIKDREMRALGLKGAHVMCLYTLGKNGALTAAEIAAKCGADKAAVSRAIADLTAGQYVAPAGEVPPRKRAYRLRLCLTEKGKGAIGYINARVAQALETCGAGLSETDRDSFYASLALIADNLKNYVKEITE